MNQYSLPILVIAGISFYVGIYHLMMYFRNRQSRRDLIFSCLCFTTTLYDIACIGLYHVSSVKAGVNWQRWQMIALSFLIIFFIWFLSDFTHYDHKLVIYIITGYFLLAALFQFFDHSHLTWILDQPSIKTIAFANGISITYYETAAGPITLLQGLMGLVWGAFIITLGVRFYQSGHKREAIPLITAMAIMYLAMVNDVAVSNEWYIFIYTIEYAYPIMILLMAFSLSRSYGDISLTQTALQESDIRYRTVIETSPDGIMITDLNGKIVACNQRQLEILGYTNEKELIGKNGFELIAPEDRERAQSIFKVFAQTKVMRNEIYRVLKKDGSKCFSEASASIITDAEGKLVSMISISRDITERKLAEEALRASEEKYRTLFETSPVGQIITRGREVLLCNPAESRLFGYDTPEEMMGRPITDLVHPDDYPTLAKIGNALTLGNRMANPITFTGLRKDGTQRIMETYAIKYPWEGENSLLSFHTDVTTRKQAEEALLNSKAFLNDVIEQSPYPLWISDDKGNLLRINQACKTLLNITDEMVVNKYNVLRDNIVIEQGCLPFVECVFEKHEPVRFDLVYDVSKMKDWNVENPSTVILDVSIFPILDTNGKFTNAIIQHIDITERKRAEKALRESEERFRSVIESSPIGFFVVNDQSIVEYANEELTQILGYPMEEIIGQNIKTALDNDNYTVVRDQYIRRMSGEEVPNRYEFTLTRKDGEKRQVELAAVIILDSTGRKMIAGQMLDITERKKAEEEVRRLNAELEQRVIMRTQQLESANSEMEAFTYSVSHDLRAPLRAIDGYARILAEDYSSVLDAEGQRLFNVISKNSQRMSRLIDDLLAFSRLNRAEMHKSTINMQEQVNSVYQELTSPEERERIRLTIKPLKPISGDISLIRQVWSNLISNAIKFTSKQSEPSIEIGCNPKETETTYYIRDNGAGFDMLYAHQLFGVFHRLHNERDFEGTGVGLAIVQRVIQRHGGRVWGKGEVDKGATFYFTLPQIRNS